jgi:hypothetical protein
VETVAENLLRFRSKPAWAPGLFEKVELPDVFLTATDTPMTEDRLALAELSAKSGDPDFLRAIAQPIIEADVDCLIRSRPARSQRQAAASASLYGGRGHGGPHRPSDRRLKAPPDYTKCRLIMTARFHTPNYTRLTDAIAAGDPAPKSHPMQIT